jgi:hypothetical protein
MLHKPMDFSTRVVLTSSPKIEVGYIGLGWHTLLQVYEPYVENYIYQKNPKILELVRQYIQKKDELDGTDFTKFIRNDVRNHSDNIKGELKDSLIEALQFVVKDAVVNVKRDPVIEKSSYFACHPIIIPNAKVAMVNPLYLGPIGGDCDGDTIQIVPIFTEEAKKEALEKLHPLYSDSFYYSTSKYKQKIYSLSLDFIATIFRATRLK